jgi:hypothetical protein
MHRYQEVLLMFHCRQDKSFLTLSLLLVMLLMVLTPAVAQDVTAAITGTVVDPSGAAISNASVIATDTLRGVAWPTHTNETGAYNLPRVPIGTYTLRIEAKGFQTAVHPAFTLTLNQTARIDVAMKVGQVGETVEVTGAAPVLQTETTEVATLIDNSTLTSMPLASRNYLQLTLLAPGATNVNPDGMRSPQSMLDSGRPYINGNREQANAYLLDGQINTETKNNEVGYTPGIDAVQEFNLITQNASAEFGNYQGGIVSATIKSGTNGYHGGLFEFFRNDKFNANNYWAGATTGLPSYKNLAGFDSNGVMNKPELRYNQFGGTFGGPIVKNKLFFFMDYQAQRFVAASATGAQLLTSAARGGDFGQLCTSFGNSFDGSGLCTGPNARQLYDPRDPRTLNADGTLAHAGTPVPYNNFTTWFAGGGSGLINGLAVPARSAAVHNLMASQYYPLPQVDSLNGNNYFFKSGHTLNNDQGDLKIDYNISDKDHVSGRWSQMNLALNPFTGFLFAAVGDGGVLKGGSTEPVRNTVVSWSHVVTPNLLNEVRFGFNAVRFDQTQTPTTSLGNIGQQFGITGANYNSPGLLNLAVGGAGFGANASVGTINIFQRFHDTQIQAEDNLNYTHGRHSIKTGFQYVRIRQDWQYAGNNGALGSIGITNSLEVMPVSGTIYANGSSLADFYFGSAGWSPRDTFMTNSMFMDRGNVIAGYIQDNWRVKNNLTLNLGLRFEDHTPIYEANGYVVNFDIKTGEILQPGKNGASKALYNNYLGLGAFQPRIGFAWSPEMFHGKTVVRGGYGISSFSEGMGSNESLSINPPYGIMQQSAGATVDAGFGPPATCSGINLACYAGNRIRITDQNFMPAITQQWNLTIQHQITPTLTAQVGYVGQHGTHLANFEDLAQEVGLNAAGQVAKPGETIVTRVAGPYLGGGTPGSLYMLDNPAPVGTGGRTLAGANMSNANQLYHALQAVLQKRMNNGLQGLLSYTWSKCMSNSSGYYGTGWGSTNAQSSGGQPGWQNIYDPRSEWGPCYFDQTHVMSGQVTYALPFGKGKKLGNNMNPVLNAIVGNWDIGSILTFHTGNALTLNMFGGWGFGGDSSHTNGIDAYTLSARPSCSGPIKVVNQYVPANPATGASGYIQWFDTSNISNAANNTFGTCGVGNVRGPHYANTDLSLHKDFPLGGEKRILEFRLEALNAFNTPVFTFLGGPNNGSFDPGQGNFGHITGSQGARQIQLGLKFHF